MKWKNWTCRQVTTTYSGTGCICTRRFACWWFWFSLFTLFLFQFRFYIQLVGHVIGWLYSSWSWDRSRTIWKIMWRGGFIFYNWQEHILGLLKWEGITFSRSIHYYDSGILHHQVLRAYAETRTGERGACIEKPWDAIIAVEIADQPALLFNTLNSINTLVGSSKEQARKVITQLSDIFRYALDSHGDKPVKLVQELDFIDNYIRIQQVRFGNRFEICEAYWLYLSRDCYSSDDPATLVENSVKYGIAPKDEGGTIVVTVKRINQMIFSK